MSHYKYEHDRPYGPTDFYTKSHRSREGNDSKHQLVSRLLGNPKLRGLLITGGIILIAVIVLLIILLFPLLQKLISYISENGLQGVINDIWKGTKE